MIVLYTRFCLDQYHIYFERYNDENFECIVECLSKIKILKKLILKIKFCLPDI